MRLARNPQLFYKGGQKGGHKTTGKRWKEADSLKNIFIFYGGSNSGRNANLKCRCRRQKKKMLSEVGWLLISYWLFDGRGDFGDVVWRTDVQISCSPGPTALIYNVHHDYCSNAMPAVKFNRPLRLIALQFHQLLCPRIAGVMLGNFLIIRRPFSFLFGIFLSSSLCRPRDCRLLKVSDPRWPHVTCQPEFVADQFKVISAAQGDSSDIFNFHKFI